MKMKIFNFIVFFSLYTILINAFDCSGLYDDACAEFTYAGSFLKEPAEKLAALNRFYQNYLANDNKNKNFTIVLDENQVFSSMFIFKSLSRESL